MCGIFGIAGHKEAAHLTYLGLHALQHRGQQAAGMMVWEEGGIREVVRKGLVVEVFDDKALQYLSGKGGGLSMGHVRYPKREKRSLQNAQPLSVTYAKGPLGVAMDGAFVNYEEVRAQLEEKGAIFQSETDAEAVMHLVAHAKEATLEAALTQALERLRGGYAMLLLAEGKLVATRDIYGIRPLVLGKRDGIWVVASETTGLDLIEAQFIREVEPGEMCVLHGEVLESHFPFAKAKRACCAFEHIYFARLDSEVFGCSVHEARKRMGAALSKVHPVAADVVIPVPDSGTAAAIGYAQAARIPYEQGLIRSHYVGRTFIEPQQSIRNFGVKLKLSAVRSVLDGKRVVVVDDSIIRGTTSKKIVALLRSMGAAEIHMRIASPPAEWPCCYGIDTPSRAELISASHSLEEVCTHIGADTLAFLSSSGLKEALRPANGFCDACVSGRYPTQLVSESD
ncbi:MAG: amidophosphoribosyltransferase [Proteobacteria bacterium]|nr:amidophosphoribosyltransferase [Cystobacterineae bacterium]MCL2313739.1 amidophosphoribosyltransferase [Pseudomonadota bacterium]